MQSSPTAFFKMTFLLFMINIVANAQQINTSYVDSVFNTNSIQHKFSGKVLIAQKGKIIFDKSYGIANHELNQSFDDKSRFQIASLSKQFTSYGILYLQQRGQLNVDDYVVKHLPDFPYSNISIRQLMTHTSGLPNFVNTMWKDLDTTKVNGNKEMLNLLQTKKYPLQWNPGDKWEYSDIGYCTLATLIEKVSGLRFDVFMKKNLFDPAGMKNTTAELYTDIRKINPSHLSIGYEYDLKNNKYLPAHLMPKNGNIRWLGGFYGDGSVVTTPYDLLKWDTALYKHTILNQESITLSTTPARLNDGSLAEIWGGNYGFGWALFNNPELGKIITHAGGHPGFLSKFIRCTDKEITVIILCNTADDTFWNFTNITDHLLLKSANQKQ
jgi:CubicO group peptidase (beta-lactamase class C family)